MARPTLPAEATHPMATYHLRRGTMDVSSPMLFSGNSPGGFKVVSPQQRLRPPAQSYDTSMMETATCGPWRRTVSQIQYMSQRSNSFEDSDNSNSEDSDESSKSWGVPGMHAWDPELYHWVASRMGNRMKAYLIVSFILLESWKTVMAERSYVEGVNTFSILVVTNFTSLVVALWITLVMEGGAGLRKVLHVHPLVRFMGISFLFTFASVLVLFAYRIGTPPVEVVTIGYIYMPISAVLSYYIFRRRYGTLEWLSVGMMTMAVLAYVLLREESKDTHDKILRPRFVVQGFGLVVGAVAISVSASILAERAFKEQSLCTIYHTGHNPTAFYIMKVHLDFSSLVISVALWFARTMLPHMFDDFFEQWSQSKEWFGTWGMPQCYMVIIATAQGWAAGMVTKEFSTVIKAISQTLAVVLVLLFEDKWLGDRFNYQARALPSILLAVILVMSAVIFQTGRINLKVLRKAANIDSEAHPDLGMNALPMPEDGEESPKKMRVQSTAVSTHQDRKPPIVPSAQLQSWREMFTTYALILVYIVSDAGRTLILQKSLQDAVINSTSMGLVCFVCGSAVASILSLVSHGFKDGLLCAWNPSKLLHCLPAAFLFALSTALANMSFTQGITSALFVVLGKFYTPVAAIGARWIMSKFYMWLEWFALLILTLASVVFGYLQAFDTSNGPRAVPLFAMLCVLLSAAVSALASLTTEKILKGEDVPFHMQKVRLDVGSIISCLALLPVLGCIATRAQDIPWAYRPVDRGTCPAESVCWDLKAGGCENPQCDCECTRGIFAGWNNPVLLLAVVINTAQGWLVGKVTRQFSVIHRAIADSFSLLAIYFIGDPIVNHTSLSNIGVNLVAFIVPTSTATFAAATSEMQKVFAAEAALRGAKDRTPGHNASGRTEESEETTEESDISDLSPAGSPSLSRLSLSDLSPHSADSPHSGASLMWSSSPYPSMQYSQAMQYRSFNDGAWM